jgi:hypothetical protein
MASIKDNRKPSSAGRRFWELSGGIFRCGGCDYVMTTNAIPSHGKKLLFYYRCAKRVAVGTGVCSQRKNYRADKVEAWAWEAVSNHMKDPEQLRADLQRMIELKKNEITHGDPDREARIWAQKIAECDRLRSAYQDQQAAGLMTLEELASKLRSLEETRKTAKRELQALQSQQEHIAGLERRNEALLEQYEAISPEALDALTPEQRHRFYKMIRLEVVANPDGSLEATWVGDGFSVSNLETGSPPPVYPTHPRRTGGTPKRRPG